MALLGLPAYRYLTGDRDERLLLVELAEETARQHKKANR
jgi:hypothetical protein